MATSKYRARLVEMPGCWEVMLIYPSGGFGETRRTATEWGARRVGRRMIKSHLRKDALEARKPIFIEQDEVE